MMLYTELSATNCTGHYSLSVSPLSNGQPLCKGRFGLERTKNITKNLIVEFKTKRRILEQDGEHFTTIAAVCEGTNMHFSMNTTKYWLISHLNCYYKIGIDYTSHCWILSTMKKKINHTDCFFLYLLLSSFSFPFLFIPPLNPPFEACGSRKAQFISNLKQGQRSPGQQRAPHPLNLWFFVKSQTLVWECSD